VSGADGTRQDHGVNSTLATGQVRSILRHHVFTDVELESFKTEVLSNASAQFLPQQSVSQQPISQSPPGSQSASLNDAHYNPPSENQQLVPIVRELSPYQLQLKERLMTNRTSLHESEHV